MFKLIALVTLKDGAPVEELLARGREFLAREPHMLRYALKADAGHTQHYTVKPAGFALLCDFNSAEDWKRYVAGPIHEELNKLFTPWRTGAVGIQYEE
jgi:hypothetical protein